MRRSTRPNGGFAALLTGSSRPGSLEDVREAAGLALEAWLQDPSTEARNSWWAAHETYLRHPAMQRASDAELTGALVWVAEGYLSYFRTHRHQQALASAIDLLTVATDQVAEGTAAAGVAHDVLASALLDRYRLDNNVSDLVSAREHGSAAVSGLPGESREWAVAAMNLAVVVLDEYMLHKRPADLSTAVERFETAGRWLEQDTEARSFLYRNRAAAYLERFHVGACTEDLERAIADYRMAMAPREVGVEEGVEIPRLLARALRVKAKTLRDLPSLQEAIGLLEEVGPDGLSDRQLGAWHVERGLAELLAHELTQDPARLDQAIRILSEGWQRDEEKVGPRLIGELGTAYLRRFEVRGRYPDLELAIASLMRAKQISRRSADAGTLNRLGNALLVRYAHHRNDADIDRAISAYREATEQPATPAILAIYRNNLGNALLTSYKHRKKAAHLDEAIRHYRRTLQTKGVSVADRSRYLANFATALKSRVFENRDVDLLDEVVVLLEQAHSLVSHESSAYVARTHALAHALAMRASLTRRAQDHDRALALWQEILDPRHRFLFGPGGAAYSVALTLLEPGHSIDERRQAINLLRECLSELKLRRLFADAESMLGYQRELVTVAATLIDGLLQHAGTSPIPPAAERRNAMADALLVAENTKSMLLIDQLSLVGMGPPGGVPATLLARERDLIARLRAADRLEQLGGPRETTTDLVEQDERTNLLVDRVVTQAELIQQWDEMESCGEEGAHYAAFRRGEPLVWDVIEQLAAQQGGDVALASLYLLKREAILFVKRAGWTYPQIAHRPFSRTDMDILRHRFLRELPGDRWGLRHLTWHRPFLELFEEARDWVRGADTVVLSLPGELWSFPFSVVADEAGWSDGGELTPMAVVPSLAVLPRLRGGARSGAGLPLVIGNPTLDLVYAEQEAVAVGERIGVNPILRELSTRASVLGRIEHAPLIHLAAHGRHVVDDPLGSGIELCDGIMSAREVLSMRLQADLVVLSACDSGLLEEIPGDELLGLGQAFLQAGARTVIMSLWRVDDDSASELMRHFYERFPKDAGPAAALAQAMDAVRAREGYQPPYHWAPFVVMGDWRHHKPTEE